MRRMKRARTVVDDDRITTFGLLHEAHGRLSHAFDRTFANAGISSPIFEVLLRIGRSKEQLKTSELARQLSVTTGDATRLVDRAVTAGLVERQACATDRRVQYVALTPLGEQTLVRITPLHLRDLEREMVGRLTPDELAALRSALHKLGRAERPPAN